MVAQENKSLEAALKAEESLADALRERLSVLGDQVLFWAYLFYVGYIFSIWGIFILVGVCLLYFGWSGAEG